MLVMTRNMEDMVDKLVMTRNMEDMVDMMVMRMCTSDRCKTSPRKNKYVPNVEMCGQNGKKCGQNVEM